MKSDDSPTFANSIKTPVMDVEKDGTMIIRAPPKRVRALPIVVVFALTVYFLSGLYRSGSWRIGCYTQEPAASWQPAVSAKELVPFEAHIMSKCPDAKDCLREMVLPAMQRVYDKVNFTLSYIGT
jgi:hypothetical protein